MTLMLCGCSAAAALAVSMAAFAPDAGRQGAQHRPEHRQQLRLPAREGGSQMVRGRLHPEERTTGSAETRTRCAEEQGSASSTSSS